MIKKALFLLLFLLMLLSCTLIGLFFLPSLADSWLIPKLTGSLPFATKEINLLRVSPWQLHGSITLANGELERIILPDISLHFTPLSLVKGVIDRIEINGGTIHLQEKEEKSDNSRSVHTPLFLPALCNTILIRNSSLFFHRHNQTSLSSINGKIETRFKQTDTGRKHLLGVQAKIALGGSFPLSAEMQAQEIKGGFSVHTSITIPDIDRFSTFFPQLNDYSPQGSLFLEGDFNTRELAAITRVSLKGTITDLHITMANASLGSAPSGQPANINIRGTENEISAAVDGLYVSGQATGPLKIKAKYSFPDGSFSGSARARLLSPSVPLEMTFSGKQEDTGTALFFHAATTGFTSGKKHTATAGPASLKGNFILQEGQINGRMSGIVESLSIGKKAELEKLSFTLPLKYPVAKKNNTVGRFSINTIRYQNSEMADAKGTLSYNRDRADFTLTLAAAFQPDLFLKCEGTFSRPVPFNGKCTLKETTLDSSTLPAFISLPPELSFRGKIQAAGQFHFDGSGFSGNVDALLNHVTLIQGETRIENINLQLNLPDLPRLNSGPSQLCTIDSITLGKISLQDARVRFRLENDQSVFIEKGGFSWCGGKMESNSFRLSQAAERLQTTLYCDRLKFTRLLEQFGIQDTEGEGSLNGKLPVIISKTGITFDNGFLFSTPGHSGIVHFNNTDQLRDNMPGIDQTPYLDYSMQALENFSYNWTRLTFNSEEDDLLIKMQLDGKPALPLPFGYKNGRIISTDQGAGLQHPVRLDLNFRLPLTELFRYGKNMQSIMENM
jgi:hypothetical protein